MSDRASSQAKASTSALHFGRHVTLEVPSSAAPLPPGSLAICTIRRDPVNSMDTELWEGLAAALAKAESLPGVRALVFRSGLAKDVFTAGNDIMELYEPATSEAQYVHFWKVSQGFLARLFRSPLATAAAIKGACPAGGTGLALCCDIRVATESATMGLNEVRLGIPVPPYWIELIVRAAGAGPVEPLLLEGRMVGAGDAASLGLVHAVVPSEAELLPRTLELLRPSVALPNPLGRATTKAGLRGDLSARWEAAAEAEARVSWKKTLSNPKTVAALEGVMQQLRGGKGQPGSGSAKKQAAGGPRAKL